MRSDKYTFRGKGSLDIPGACITPFRGGRASGGGVRIVGVNQAGTLSEASGVFSDAECVAKVDANGARKRCFYRFAEPVSEFRAIFFLAPGSDDSIIFSISGASTGVIGGSGGVLLIHGITNDDLDLTTLTWANQSSLNYVLPLSDEADLLAGFSGAPDPGATFSPRMIAAGSLPAGATTWLGNVTCYGMRVMWIADDAIDPADNVTVSKLGRVGRVHIFAEDFLE